jgi:hypothetical protein
MLSCLVSSRPQIQPRFQSQNLSASAKFISFIFTLFCFPYPLSPVFATLTKTPGVASNNSHFGTWSFGLRQPGCRFFGVRSVLTLQQIVHHPFPLLHFPKIHSFVFRYFHPLLLFRGGRGAYVFHFHSWNFVFTFDSQLSTTCPEFRGVNFPLYCPL